MSTAAQTLAERIYELRIESRLTQDETAARLGISRMALSHFETRKRRPGILMLDTIADHFNVSTDYLLGRTNERGTSV
ncbi:helix-turn-helix domain-containing protein [Paenibacillus methanolicus]|uniref:DNA-binding XRE family transcriptional regulator n=1 Tax=Paenibacillus methanolicus TaxID=582686 RepID=A0A5S5BNX4_9BACL|nr:helix-turn-helix transcriptional regulator [Paenibacillus methanolicus]TYP68895.1 DNA-binding XRE family transcriptional regulator [Paenibacillus methanolicus]